MKTIWKGALNFGLVTINIELFDAIQEHAVSFKLLHDACHTPIHNLRWCNHCNKAVPWNHVVKGLPLTKEKFFVMTKEALKTLKPLKNDTLVLQTFIPEANFDPIWSDQHYYVLPQKENDRAYALFVTVLTTSKKIAIGTIIFKDKEHICAIRPYQDRLLMTTLHYAYEIRPLPTHKTTLRFTTKELELAQYLVAKLSKKKIALENFKDTFIEKLKVLIRKQPAKKQISAKKTKTVKEPLVQALEKSLKISKPRTKKS